MTRAEADEKLYKRELVEYLQAVGPKTLVREWKLTGSVDATMRRTSREYLLNLSFPLVCSHVLVPSRALRFCPAQDKT